MSIFTKRSTRIVAGSLAGALALSVTPILGFVGTATAADALPPLADPIGAGNFCENAPTTEPFTDVSATDPAIDEIICLVATELTTGVTATTYEPNSPITRRQMALFIKRVADLANELDTGTNIAPLPAYDGAPDFLDIAGESAAVKEAIGQLVQADIVQGTSATAYSPAGLVSRRQMAAFINRLQDFLTGDPFTTTGDFFNDDAGDTGEDNLNAVASVGIFQGDGAGNVDPGGNLTRRQMAFVLLRYLQVALDAGDINPAFAPSTNATIPNNKVGVQMLPFDTNDDGTTATSAIFTGLTNGVDYHVALFQNVTGNEGEIQTVVNTNGIFTFRDKQDSENLPFDGRADYECTSYNGAEIVSINGDPIGSTCEYDIQPENGQFDVRVENANDLSDAVWLVVWRDADDDDELDLKADNTPSEVFGAAGPFIWHGGEAPTGNTDLNGEYIIWVDPATKSFVSGDTWMYVWDSNDLFNYDEEYNITLADFEAWFNANDYLYGEDVDGTTIPYSRNRAAVNEFSLYDEGANAPSGATAVVGDLDDDAVDVSANDVRVTWAHDPELGNMEEDDDQDAGYCIYRYAAAAITAGSVDSDCFYYSDNDAVSDAAIANKTVVIENVVPGNWVFTVSAYTADGSYESDESEPSNAVTSVISSVAGAPVTQAVPTGATHTDANSNGIVDNGDTLVFTFNEAMADPAADAQISLNDGADATAGLLINGSNATFTKLASNRIAVIVGAAGPVILNAGTTPGLQYVGLRVSDAGDATTGITDLTEGLQWNITGVAHPAQDLEP